VFGSRRDAGVQPEAFDDTLDLDPDLGRRDRDPARAAPLI
jgi:hypothetical protein